MKNQIIQTLLVVILCLGSIYSYATKEVYESSGKSAIHSLSSDQDSNVINHWQKIKWDVALGVIKTKANSFSLTTSLSYPVNDFLRVQASTGLVTLRGPVFAYRTERYFNEYATYGYDIENYTVGNYLAYQLSLGLEISMPFNENIILSTAPYYLRLMRSTYITKSWESYSSTDPNLRNGGVDGSESKWAGAISSFNYGFQGISINDFGLQLGLGYRFKRFGFTAQRNFGFTDWGDDSFFGDKRETMSFNSIKVSYTIKNNK